MAARRWPRIGVANQIVWVKPLADPLGGTTRARGRHPGEDVRTDRAGRRAGVRRAADSRAVAVLGRMSARVRPSATVGDCRDSERRGHDAVPRSAVGEAGAARRLGGVAPGRLHALGHAGRSTKTATASASWCSCTAATLRTDCGWCRVRIARKRTSRRWSRAAGSDRLPDAVPLICAPGDVAMCNRQALHCSFANTSDEVRVTVNFGFHRRKSILGVERAAMRRTRSYSTTRAFASDRG